MLAPPYSSDTVMPSTPTSPILRHRSIGNRSLRSISAARGAISACANSRTAWRSASISSPSWKFRPGKSMARDPRLDVYVNVNYASGGLARFLHAGQQCAGFALVHLHFVQIGLQVGHLL